MIQIGVNITTFPKTDAGYGCAVVAIEYFSKWPEARTLEDHSAVNVATFLFEDMIYRPHGYVKI